MNLFNLLTMRGDREAATRLTGINRVAEQAERMLLDGQLTLEEKRELDAKLLTEFMDQLPMETYVEMRKDGRWKTLEQLTAHDGTRDAYDVNRQRDGLARKVMREALSEMWEDGYIDDDGYKNETQLGAPDDLKEAIAEKHEDSTIDAYILNKFGEEGYKEYRADVRKKLEASKEPEDSDEVAADDVKSFNERHGVEPDLTADDWEQAKGLKRAYEVGGREGFETAVREGVVPPADEPEAF